MTGIFDNQSLVDLTHVPQPSAPPTVTNDVCPGANDRETCANTLHAYGTGTIWLRASKAPPEWVDHTTLKLPASPVESTQRALGMWYSHELPFDLTLRPNTVALIRYAQDLLHSRYGAHAPGTIRLETADLGPRRGAYSTAQAFSMAVRNARENLPDCPRLWVSPTGEGHPLFLFPYVRDRSLHVASTIERSRLQGWRGFKVTPHEFRTPPGVEHLKRYVMALLGGLQAPWDSQGIVGPAALPAWHTMLPTLMLALPIANEHDPVLAQDIANLAAIYTNLGKPSEWQHKVERVWVYWVMLRVRDLLMERQKHRDYHAIAVATQARLELLGRPSGGDGTGDGAQPVVMPFRFPLPVV